MSDRVSREHDARVERIADDQWERELGARRAAALDIERRHELETGCPGALDIETGDCMICGDDLLNGELLSG